MLYRYTFTRKGVVIISDSECGVFQSREEALTAARRALVSRVERGEATARNAREQLQRLDAGQGILYREARPWRG